MFSLTQYNLGIFKHSSTNTANQLEHSMLELIVAFFELMSFEAGLNYCFPMLPE